MKARVSTPTRVCVVGGSGFLGGAIVSELLERGCEVAVLDQSEPRVSAINLTFVKGSLLDPVAVDTALSGAQTVFNCAAIADLRDAQTDPAATIEINTIGTIGLLQRSIALGVNRFVLASSVYASSRHGGFYRISKQAAEVSVVELCRGSGTRYTILRYGSLYGPGAPAWNGLRRLVQAAVDERRLEYSGRPEAVREYIHVQDAARLSVDALSDEFADKSLLVTGMESYRVYDVLKMLGEILGLDSEPSFELHPDRDHYIRTPYAHESLRAHKLVPNYHIDLAQGLLEVINEIDRVNSTSTMEG
jgi:UDP-glucose 4-epimerase